MVMGQVVQETAWGMGRSSGSETGWLTHHRSHDSQTQIRRISVVFAEEGCGDRKAAQPWDIFNAGEGEEARARRSVFQEALGAGIEDESRKARACNKATQVWGRIEAEVGEQG
jgi:hypothetical protein